MTPAQKHRAYLERCRDYHTEEANHWHLAAEAVAKLRPDETALRQVAQIHSDAAAQFETALSLAASLCLALLLVCGCATAPKRAGLAGILASVPGGYQVTAQFAADHPGAQLAPLPGCFFISQAEMAKLLTARRQ